MMKFKSRVHMKAILGLILAFSYLQLDGQSVLAAAGGSDTQKQLTLEWTLGEVFVESVSTRENWFTEGFHQPLLSTRPVNSSAGGYDIKIFPNPTQDLLNVSIKTPLSESIELSLSDVTGKIIFTRKVPSGSPEIQLRVKEVPEGMYLLSVENQQGYRIGSFKVIKL